MEYEVVIGLEVHTEMLTESKMFCACPVVNYTTAAPNIAVCPVCAGMPGVLPVINQKAVEYAVRVGLALECEIAPVSIFARKNYFYPDLPKGYQISQFEEPLASNGRLKIQTSQGEKTIRILRAHLEEDAGKLTHMERDGETYSLVDLNRAGVALLEIVTEPDMRSVEEAVAYGRALRDIIRYVGVNSGDMSKGVMRFEANVSVREAGSDVLNPRAEIKNLNSFRAMERAVNYQIEQQIAKMERGEKVEQETLGWDEARQETYSQRSKEDAHDYRYFPEPDLPPLVLEPAWMDEIAASLPELPQAKAARFQLQFGLTEVDANLLAGEQEIANFLEAVLAAGPSLPPRLAANWMTGEIFGWMNTSGETIDGLQVTPQGLADLLALLEKGEINAPTAKTVLTGMLETGQSAGEIITARGLRQISDTGAIAGLVRQVLEQNPNELETCLAGKDSLSNWFFGQVMRAARGKANPQVVREELMRQLAAANELSDKRDQAA
ncbi:MAG: Asp-tRNA(Asn)/Glu-tRNA(Gln) amidotransferase subunit GatB [Anaerolineaceae bacterium]|jgi:aspartyl-tRNA(Asn)/glutamyl-tRNA(Gln) amidotransferase subunit B|nr:Asp-tRNA(Asn)/Glu-tRNA(Gln) amidotransferase subunit GatB [Anaerolineaceae bacterium]